MSKYFSQWRFNSACQKMELQNEAFMKEHCIENERKLLQNIKNLPLLTLMLEEICKEKSDHC